MKNFVNTITDNTIIDVLVSGYVDFEKNLIFHPMYDRIYFVFDSMKFEISIDDFGFINVSNIAKIEKWFDLDEDNCFSLMSIYSQLFKTEQKVVITSVDNQSGPFDSLALIYRDGFIERRLYLDPNNFFGFTFL